MIETFIGIKTEQCHELAEVFGLVEDFYGDGIQYWVFRGNQVWPFAELSGEFTAGWLSKRLGR